MITPGKAHLVADAQYKRRVLYLRQAGRHEEAETEIREHMAESIRRTAVSEHACKIERSLAQGGRPADAAGKSKSGGDL